MAYIITNKDTCCELGGFELNYPTQAELKKIKGVPNPYARNIALSEGRIILMDDVIEVQRRRVKINNEKEKRGRKHQSAFVSIPKSDKE